MATRIQSSTLRRLFPRSKFPISRGLADVANTLRSARLVEQAHQVRVLEIDSNALNAMLDAKR